MLKGVYVWVTHTWSARACISTQDGMEIKDDRSDPGEGGSSVLCAEHEGSERNGTSPFNHHIVFCKVRLVVAWIKRREVVDGARRIKSEKLREH